MEDWLFEGQVEPERENPNFHLRLWSWTWLRFLKNHWSGYTWTEKTRMPNHSTLLRWLTILIDDETKEDQTDSICFGKTKIFKRGKDRKSPDSAESKYIM